MIDLNKRIFTSILLIGVLYLSVKSYLFLFIILILTLFQIYYEFFILLRKFFFNKNEKILIFLFIILIYLTTIVITIWNILYSNNFDNKLQLYLIISVCVFTDIGGYIFGKIFGGKKLTKISPNKTYSGMIGSYSLSLLITFFLFKNYITFDLIIMISLLTSTVSQAGDLFISYLKRKSKLKDTGNILPGHGGLLDRFDGLIFAIPFGLSLFKLL